MIPSKQLIFALSSIVMGAWTFIKVNEISGPTFEPILEACKLPMIEFQETDYHAYDPNVGLGVFNILVCLITQFLLEVRETYPEGFLVWGALIVTALPFSCMSHIEAGREGAKGPIRYPILLGMSYQLFGASVMMPLVWLPSYIYGRGNGAVSLARAYSTVPMIIPSLLLSIICFTADTAGSLWTTSAGILGGPALPLLAAVMWADTVPSNSSKDDLLKGSKAASRTYLTTVAIGLVAHYVLFYTAVSTYGFSLSALWGAIWTNGNGSTRFLTMDTIVLWLGVSLHIFYQDATSGLKVFLLSPIMGPGAACSFVLAGLEESNAAANALLDKKAA